MPDFFSHLLVASPWEGRYQVLANNNLQIRQVTKADEGVYRCEASVEARGEIDFVDIAVVVNGECAAVRQNTSGSTLSVLLPVRQSGLKHHKEKKKHRDSLLPLLLSTFEQACH